MKVGKEEIMGMLAAVEAWGKRDHQAEWREWESRLSHIASKLSAIPTLSSRIIQPTADLSNRTPSLRIEWDPAKINLSGQHLAKLMLDTEPRVVVANPAAAAISIVPYMLMPGEEKIIASKLHSILSAPPAMPPPQSPSTPAANITGQWDLNLDFGRGSATHTLIFEQDGNTLLGTHRGEFDQGNLTGSISGNQVRFRSNLPTIGSRLSFDFNASHEGGQLRGTVNLGEYGQANFIATRHKYV